MQMQFRINILINYIDILITIVALFYCGFCLMLSKQHHTPVWEAFEAKV